MFRRVLVLNRKIVVSLVSILYLLLSSLNAYAVSDAEKTFLAMYFKEDELIVLSATRSLKSITRIAENVEVVTKEDIELMNAHTLADVLNSVNGVYVNFGGASPGSIAAASIHGSANEHVVVMFDGVSINTASDFADLSAIPAQMIDKVEIIKGPASSVWGSSLGGIINVITKSPRNSETPGGTVSASYGKKNTADMSAELTGKKGSLGYYLMAGRLQTDGLSPVEEISSNYLYLKLKYDLTNRTNLVLSFFYNQGDREEGDLSSFDLSFKDRIKNLIATMSLNSSLSEGVDLNLSLRAAKLKTDLNIGTLSTGESSTSVEDDRKYGASARLNWKTGIHNIVLGSDYDYKEIRGNIFTTPPSLNVFALYGNDTMIINKLAITPGIRYDNTDRNNNFVSPSLGITYDLADKTILRAVAARGFHLPNLGADTLDGEFGFRHNPDLKPEEVWSYQAGLESGLLKYIWLKASVFRHDIRNAIVVQDIDVDAGTYTVVNKDKVRRQGVEFALRSMKIYNFALSAAATFVKAENTTTGEEIKEWPAYTYDVSLKYDDEKSLRALLQGRYAWWHHDGAANAKAGFILDANVIKTIFKKQDRACEIFLTGHNIFDGTQYWNDLFRNAKRWIEAGVRYKF
ncbi:MAG: TonB-dependent receptor [Nitrospirae bacterium]|nr:MAG: TonB-dependent receptor [Nitrospirota bacterium]